MDSGLAASDLGFTRDRHYTNAHIGNSRCAAAPRNDAAYDSNFEIALLGMEAKIADVAETGPAATPGSDAKCFNAKCPNAGRFNLTGICFSLV